MAEAWKFSAGACRKREVERKPLALHCVKTFLRALSAMRSPTVGCFVSTARDFGICYPAHRLRRRKSGARAKRPRGSDQCWLDTQNIVADAWDLAPVLVSARIDQGVLDVFEAHGPDARS